MTDFGIVVTLIIQLILPAPQGSDSSEEVGPIVYRKQVEDQDACIDAARDYFKRAIAGTIRNGGRIRVTCDGDVPDRVEN